MKVLMITADRRFGPGHPRYELQRSAVEMLTVVYWGRGVLLPAVPEGQFDVVTSQDPFWRGLYAWRVSKRLGASFNVQVHADFSKLPLSKRLLGMFVLRRADSIRVVSEKIRSDFAALQLSGKMTVLPVFINVAKFASIVHRPHESKNIVWIGRFEKEKNPLFAIEILKQVLKAVPSARLRMIGAGNLRERIGQVVANLPVELWDWQTNQSALYDTADVVLSTSEHESYGASIIEALAAGIPVVAPDVGVAREAGAIVVDREKLASAVIEVLNTKKKGELKLSLLTAYEWASAWKESLI